MKICSECGATWRDSKETCDKCGAELPAAVVEAPTSYSKAKGRITTYIVVFCSLCIIAGAILWLFIEGRDRNALLYTENGTYYYVDQYDKPIALFSTEKGELRDPRVCADGDYLFYLSGDGEDATLYRVRLNGSGHTPTAVSAGVKDYCVSDDGKTVVVKDTQDALYRIHREKKEAVAEDVCDFILAADGESIVYNTADGTLCNKAVRGNPDILGQNVDALCLASDDLTTLIGQEEERWFCLAGWNDTVYLTDGTKTAQVISYDDGTCYFTDSKGALCFERGTEVDAEKKDRCKYETVCRDKYSILSVSPGEPLLILRTDTGCYLVKEEEMKKLDASLTDTDGLSYLQGKIWYLDEDGTLTLRGTDKGDEVLTYEGVTQVLPIGKRLFYTDEDGVCYRVEKSGKAEALNQGGAALYRDLQAGTARYSLSARENGGR